MDSRLVLRNLGPTKTNQVVEFPLAQVTTITIGRDPSCDVKYDPDQDDLISRRHAKISTEKTEPPEFILTDLGSKNGTFLNKQRIFTPARIVPGDVVQLGAGGPEFQFDVEPRPQGEARPTRLATLDGGSISAVAPTREAPIPGTPPVPPLSATHAPATAPYPVSSSGTVGRATVERMITQVKSQGRRNTMIATAALLVVITISGSVFALVRHIREKSQPVVMTPTEISKEYTGSTMYVQAAWKLYYMGSGRQLFQLYEPNKVKDEQGVHRLVDIPEEYVPVFQQINGVVMPRLTTSNGAGHNKAIGEILAGTGFAVSADGFIITNRHVAAPWTLPYEWQEDGGILAIFDADGKPTFKVISRNQFPDNWVPSKAQYIDEGAGLSAIRKSAFAETKPVEGRNDFLDVTPAMNRMRISARLVRVSDHADVALLKIDVPHPLRPILLNPNAEGIHRGDPVTTLGYPKVSPELLGIARTATAQNTGPEETTVPDATLSVGNIGRIIHDRRGSTESVFSTIGDVYQLTINSTGHGNSGGPLFDEHGQAIGIFTYGRYVSGDASMSFAVPIKYALDLMNVNNPNE